MVNKNMKVLFTGGGGAGNELIYRLLGDKYDIYFADASKDNINPLIPEEKRLEIPFASHENFVSEIVSICKLHNIDLLIPSVDEELPFMKDVQGALPSLDILLPDHEHVVLMMDKLKLMQTFADKGVDAPYTTTLDNIDELSYPFFVKPRWGRGSRGIQVIYSESDLKQYRTNSEYEDSEIIAQDLMSGVEYTVMMSADRYGRLHAIVPVKVDLKKGITIKAETERNNLVTNACQKIHNVFLTKGCYNIQVFLQPDGTVLPIEINPRISTTFCLGISSGVEAIENYFKEEKSSTLDKNWKSEVKLHRHWVNYISKDK
ncbi:ATP-grasp domain-containing protein [Vibrio sp. 10N.261.52.C2]|uniref:ATP-grasp domain-containing protein n=1 Tax=Vibrio sp. 10N.261.52.C2 TaxID=3229681 RepID=UPI0035513F50